MEFDKELFVEAFMEILSHLNPMFFIMISITLGTSIVRLVRQVLDTPVSSNRINIEDDEDYIDEDDYNDFYADEEESESVNRYNYDHSVDFILNNNEDPIKRR